MAHADPADRDAALALLRELGASPRLIHHCEIVSDVAAQISEQFTRLGIEHDAVLVTVGAALHDAGKVTHPEELVSPGRLHEVAGERLLLDHGLSARLARVCRTHGSWDRDEVAIEDLLVAVADHVWKGTRGEQVERLLIADVATRRAVNPWEVFLLLDPVFEEVAAGGVARLARASR